MTNITIVGAGCGADLFVAALVSFFAVRIAASLRRRLPAT